MKTSTFYVLSLIIGAIVPFLFAIEHLKWFGLNPIAFVQEAMMTSASRACFVDLTLSGIVFLVFVFIDVRRRRAPMHEFWISLALTPVGLVSTVAYYLWRRELVNRQVR